LFFPHSFGYNSKQSALLNIPTGVAGALAAMFSGYSAGHFNSRGLVIICLMFPGIIGSSLMAFLPSHYKIGKIIGIYLTAMFGPSEFVFSR
jgi:hypothetical protein